MGDDGGSGNDTGPHRSLTSTGGIAPTYDGPWGSLRATDGSSRSNGWTGERMATFCETLADTGLVVDACLAAGKSTVGAYALRRRSPIFAAAWEAALTIARERLADTLLARSIEGGVEQYYKDGELVGEKRVIDNRLGLAILRRLDRLAETGSPVSTRGERRAPAVRPQRAMDWDLALSALRSREPDAVAEALAMLSGKGDELNELNGPPDSFVERDDEADDDDDEDEDNPCWQQDECGETVWMTSFPPPDGFTGYQKGDWGDEDYERECSAEERSLLERTVAAELGEGRAEEEAVRDSWFARLEAQLADESGGEAQGRLGPEAS